MATTKTTKIYSMAKGSKFSNDLNTVVRQAKQDMIDANESDCFISFVLKECLDGFMLFGFSDLGRIYQRTIRVNDFVTKTQTDKVEGVYYTMFEDNDNIQYADTCLEYSSSGWKDKIEYDEEYDDEEYDEEYDDEEYDDE